MVLRQPHGTLFPDRNLSFPGGRRDLHRHPRLRAHPRHAAVVQPSLGGEMAQRLPEKLQRQAGGSAHDPRNLLQIRPEQQTAVVHRYRQRFRLHGTLRMSRLGPDLPPRRAGLRHQAGRLGLLRLRVRRHSRHADLRLAERQGVPRTARRSHDPLHGDRRGIHLPLLAVLVELFHRHHVADRHPDFSSTVR